MECTFFKVGENKELRKSSDQSEDLDLPLFVPEKAIASVPALVGFSPDEIFVTTFSAEDSSHRLIHHPVFYRIVICDEFPSQCYGDLSNFENKILSYLDE